MSSNPQQPARVWLPPDKADIIAGFQNAFQERPEVMTLTIILKLLTQRGTEALLATTQQRYTNMLHEVTVRFFDDLERIDAGETPLRLIDAVIGLVAPSATSSEKHQALLAQLRSALYVLCEGTQGANFVQAIIKAAAAEDVQREPHNGWGLLRHFLEQWYRTHADKHMANTIEKAESATKQVVVKDEAGNTVKDAHGQPVKEVVKRFTPEVVTHIKLALTLRRALVGQHTAHAWTVQATDIAVQALRQGNGSDAFVHITNTLNERCIGERLYDVVTTLTDVVQQHTPIPEYTPAAHGALEAHLHQLAFDMSAQWSSALRAKRLKGLEPRVRPFLLLVIDGLAQEEPPQAILPLQRCLDRWYRNLTEKQKQEQFTPNDLICVQSFLDANKRTNQATHRLGAGLLVQRVMQTHGAVPTDVLLLASLAEKATRGIGDGVELLSGILSNCYSEVCSVYRYPLSSVLRGAVFANRAAAIVGWSQLMADYLAKQNKQRPGNELPSRKKGAAKTFSLIDLFRGQRVVRIGLAYHLWKHEDAAFQSTVATTVPVGPDVGKTLGNPTAHATLRRQRAARRRRVTVLGRGVVGKRGARRIKTWLLPPNVRREVLDTLEVLIYDQLDWSDAVRAAARTARHPYWAKRTKRGVRAVRPTQFRQKPHKYPQRLRDLSLEQQIKLREELREQERYAGQFESFQQALNRFLDGAPPAPPFITPIVLTEAEVAQLALAAQDKVPESFEALKQQYDRAADWYHDFRPRRGDRNSLYSDEKLFDVETIARWEFEWSAAELARSEPQPIWFHRGMDADFQPSSFALLYYLRQSKQEEYHRFIFACDLVGATAKERESLLAKERIGNQNSVVNFLVNQPDQQVNPPAKSTLQFFATEMGADHQERILLEYMDWRRRMPHITTHLISTASIISERRTSRRVDWYVHLPVPLPVPSSYAELDACIGFHEYEGTFYYAVLDLEGQLLAMGEVDLPPHVRLKGNDGMTNDNFAFETAIRMVRSSLMERYQHRSHNHAVAYTAYIGIENTGWKHDQVGTDVVENRKNVSLPRQRIFEIACYKAVQHGLPLPLHIKGIAPSRDCGRCGQRTTSGSGVEMRTVTRCFLCHTLGRQHKLVACGSDAHLQCSTCNHMWQQKEPQFKCQHCRYQQYTRYNTALVTVHRTIDVLVERTNNDESE